MSDGSCSSIRERKLLMQRIQELGSTEHAEIFKMLSASGIDYSQNNNGVFVNLSAVPPSVLREINTFVSFCIDNNHNLIEYDKRMSECKMNTNTNTADLPARHDDVHLPNPEPQLATDTAIANTTATTMYTENPALADAKRLEHARFAQARKRFSKRRLQENSKRGDGADFTTDCLIPE